MTHFMYKKKRDISLSFQNLVGLFFCVISIATLAAEITLETEDSEIILSSEPTEANLQGYSNAVILPLPGGGSIMALRTADTGEAAYTFTLEDANLVAVLQALAESMTPPVEITASPYNTSIENDPLSISAPTVSVKTALAYIISVSFRVADANINQVIDQAAIASGCNIYLDSRIIVVDRC